MSRSVSLCPVQRLYNGAVSGDVDPLLRIGELGRRVGVSPELLRAWERRYGLLDPARTDGGLRLYSADDERRVRAMKTHLESGVSAAEAARLALATETQVAPAAPSDYALQRERAELRHALDALDADAAHVILDRAFGAFTLETVLTGLLLPYLCDLGERWERGEASVGQEHFASNLLRARLLALARGWERGEGQAALVACASGEQHDLPLIMFGLALRNRGWRIVFLGADTPAATIAETADQVAPELVVISAVNPDVLGREAPVLETLARDRRLALAGRGADPALARALGCEVLAGDPVAAAASV
jgi:MerR family transcriptional regulator, light-induced transcriptional regulator